MWLHLKDKQPIPGSTIEILYKNKVLEVDVGINSVYNLKDNESLILLDDFEIWREKEAKAT